MMLINALGRPRRDLNTWSKGMGGRVVPPSAFAGPTCASSAPSGRRRSSRLRRGAWAGMPLHANGMETLLAATRDGTSMFRTLTAHYRDLGFGAGGTGEPISVADPSRICISCLRPATVTVTHCPRAPQVSPSSLHSPCWLRTAFVADLWALLHHHGTMLSHLERPVPPYEATSHDACACMWRRWLWSALAHPWHCLVWYWPGPPTSLGGRWPPQVQATVCVCSGRHLQACSRPRGAVLLDHTRQQHTFTLGPCLGPNGHSKPALLQAMWLYLKGSFRL